MENTVVLYPSPGRGHVVSTVEFGKLLLRHYPAVTITVVVIPLSTETTITDGYLQSVAAAVPTINFLRLPVLSTAVEGGGGATAIPTLLYQLPLLQNTHLRDHLSDLSRTKRIKALVIDFFCNAAVSVADELELPFYYYFPNSACSLALFLYFPVIHENSTASLKDLDSPVRVPGLPSIPVKDIPPAMADRGERAYSGFIGTAYNMRKSAGLIVNTFDSLEPNAIRAMLEGKCTPNGSPPPIYCVGPIVEESGDGGRRRLTEEKEGVKDSSHVCLTWLDSQPKGSVVFLCFGSMGVFSSTQIAEMAVGLERSRVRFLWVVRNPPPGDETGGRMSAASEEFVLDSILPAGFLDRTAERGFVAKMWAPQVEVLNHRSVGGFVTHCGWNSVVESLCAGVPMVGWPIYAEQRLNRHFLVNELGVALELTESEGGIVKSEELEKRLAELMSDSGKGKAVRGRVTEMKEGAAAAMSGGGSSRAAINKLVESFKLG